MGTRPRIPFFVPVSNTIARRLLRRGAFMGPNALLSVRGRRTGAVRTTPVAVVDSAGRRWIVGTFGETNWVRNLRAAREGTVTVGRHTERVRAVELSRAEAESFFTDVLGPYVGRTALARWMLGLLHARDILDDPHGAAERHPVFELHPAERREAARRPGVATSSAG